jgi:plastocyanin
MTTDDATPVDGDAAAQAEPVPSDESTANVATGTAGEPVDVHPYRERYLVPFLFPLLIVIGIVFFVLNVSRLFISTAGSAAVIIAAIMTVLILFGAAVLSAAPKMRSSSLALIVIGSLVVVGSMGWLTVGHAEEEEEEAIALGDPIGSLTVNATPDIKFDPTQAEAPFDPNSSAAAPTVIEISLHDVAAGQHTLAFDDPSVIWNVPQVNAADETITEKAGFVQAGDYVYYCTIPGHREAGMEGTLTVSPDVKASGGGGDGEGTAPSTTAPAG